MKGLWLCAGRDRGTRRTYVAKSCHLPSLVILILQTAPQQLKSTKEFSADPDGYNSGEGCEVPCIGDSETANYEPDDPDRYCCDGVWAPGFGTKPSKTLNPKTRRNPVAHFS